MKVVFDYTRYYDFVLYELDFEEMRLYNSLSKYFITNGHIGLFGNNKQHMVHAMRVLCGKY